MLTNKQKLEFIWWIRGEFSFWLDKEIKKQRGSKWYGWSKDVGRFLNELEVKLLEEKK